MKNGRYESIKEWLVCIKNDFNESIKGAGLTSKPVELILLQLANFVLLTFFVYSLINILTPHIQSWISYVDIIKYKYTVAFVVIFLLESIRKCLDHFGFVPINRFGIFHVFKFDLKPSYQIYIFLVAINLLLLVPHKYLKNNEYARGK